MSEQFGWHFLPDDGLLANHDGRKVVVGETLRVEPPLTMCVHGLHWCRRAIDALEYAPGALACYVRASGETLEEKDKCCSTERTVIAMADATTLLHEFACWCAKGALRGANITDAHCWNAIATKRHWLHGEVTDEELTATALAAWGASAALGARAAARAASLDAAMLAPPGARAAPRAAARAAQNTELECRLRELLGLAAKP